MIHTINGDEVPFYPMYIALGYIGFPKHVLGSRRFCRATVVSLLFDASPAWGLLPTVLGRMSCFPWATRDGWTDRLTYFT